MNDKPNAFLKSLAPATKERLTESDEPGWYECLSINNAVMTAVFFWDGKYLRTTKEPIDGRGNVAMDLCTNFRGPLSANTKEQA